ncbi:MAG: hypothetical protein PHN19_05805 [Patescibacteria group bacterium]|nr:hypothetical protein [Patescibacteria group bacterium]
MTLNKKQKIWLIIGTSIGVIIIYSGLVIYPQTSDIFELNNKIYKEKIRQEELKVQENDIKQAKDRESDVDAILNQLSVHLTTKDDILNFIVELENIAKQTNNTQEINILEQTNAPKTKKTENEDATKSTNTDTSANTQTTTNQSQAEKSSNYIEVEVKLQGSFDSLISYLDELKKTTILTDEISLETQLAELASSEAGTQLMQNEEAPTTSDLSSIINLKVYIKDQNDAK